jgi:osmotically inducible protein OsmC
MIKKKGSARWSGGLKDGKGAVSTESGVLDDVPYGFRRRFEGEAGSNPEELIGAAHAACFSMALSLVLGQSDLSPDEIATTATVSVEQTDGGFAITKVHLDVTAKVPGADEAKFLEAANGAKENCPVSKLLNAEITMDAKLA